MNKALEVLNKRGFIKQCTDIESLSRLLDRESTAFYVGLDPTAPSLHVGHMVPLFALVHMSKAGHKPIVLTGGGTARIGDPSGKTEMRKMLSVEQIQKNANAINDQMKDFLNTQNVEATYVDNAEWLAELNYIEFLRDIGVHFSVNRMLSFETYKMRLETGLSFIEFNYQLLQSYDFLELNRRYACLLQIGGDDQWGNIVAGTDLIRRVNGNEAYGLTFPLVSRADGKKMGKTEKGALFLDPNLTSPYDFFQYWRNVPDQDVKKFLYLYTFLSREEVEELAGLKGQEINRAKERLAHELSRLVHGKDEADKALEASKAAFGGGGEDLSSVPSIQLPIPDEGIPVVDLFEATDLCNSKAEARRLINQGGANINDRKVESIDLIVDKSWIENGELLLRAGKKRYFRVIPG